jgi:hypothetical protein
LDWAHNSRAIDRRRLFTGAGALLATMGLANTSAQDPAPIPVPVRIQTPDLVFVDVLQQQLDRFELVADSAPLLLSIVPAEPAPDSLLNDLRLNGRRFSGSFVPSWLIPDLVRDEFISEAPPPPSPLPSAIAHLRSFGGTWIATDFDHDCDVLFLRTDLMPIVPETWEQLLVSAESAGLGLAIPRTHAQQIVDHFCSMAASIVGEAEFWFEPESMDPAIASPAHVTALEMWKELARHTPASASLGSTGDLWRSFTEGESAALVASSDFLPYALQQGLDPAMVAVTPLPGAASPTGDVRRVGNTTGPNWGGVTIAGSSQHQMVMTFLEFLADPVTQRELSTNIASGISPAPIEPTEFLNAFTALGWPAEVTQSWLDAIASTLTNPFQLQPLRIAETRRYLLALEKRIVAFLETENASAADALAAAAEDWRGINDAIDVDVQRDLFARSRMAPPTQKAT